MEQTPDFTVTSTITFRPFRGPPRCRKPRQVEETFTHDFTIPCVTSEKAPVVALVPDDRGYYDSPTGEEAPLRAYNGQLYVGWNRGRKPVMAGSDAFPASTRTKSGRTGRPRRSEIKRIVHCLLVIDGQMWKTTREPAYAIITMGMGGNYLEIDYQGRYAASSQQ